MTRKDYAAVAAVLAKYRQSQANVPLGSAMAMLSLDLADVFADDNPRFDREKWFTATNAE